MASKKPISTVLLSIVLAAVALFLIMAAESGFLLALGLFILVADLALITNLANGSNSKKGKKRSKSNKSSSSSSGETITSITNPRGNEYKVYGPNRQLLCTTHIDGELAG